MSLIDFLDGYAVVVGRARDAKVRLRWIRFGRRMGNAGSDDNSTGGVVPPAFLSQVKLPSCLPDNATRRDPRKTGERAARRLKLSIQRAGRFASKKARTWRTASGIRSFGSFHG